MQNADLLLLFVAMPGDVHELDQIRVMKGMFLLSKEGPPISRDAYRFRPYDFGPFDRQVYDDLDNLQARGLIVSEPVMGTNRRLFRVTSRGQVAADEVESHLSESDVAAIGRTKQLVTSMTFLQLLRYVYGNYPAFAVASIART